MSKSGKEQDHFTEAMAKQFSIPNAKDFQPDPHVEDESRYEQWLDHARRVITQQINDNRDSLKSGELIRIVCPGFRDMGFFQRMWNKHFQVLVEELRQNNWIVYDEVHMAIAGNLVLQIRSQDAPTTPIVDTDIYKP